MEFKVSLSPHNYETKEGAQSVRWIKLSELKKLSILVPNKFIESNYGKDLRSFINKFNLSISFERCIRFIIKALYNSPHAIKLH